MFNFLKKYKPINEYGDVWNLGQGMYDNKPIFTRIRSSLKDAIGHPDYPFQIGVAIPLVNPTHDGLPDDIESKTLGDIEDKIADALKKNTVFVASITTNGMRELVFYANSWNPEEFEAIVNDVSDFFPSHVLQFMIQQDPKWQTFKNFI